MRWLLLKGLVRDARHTGEFPALLQARMGHAPLSLDHAGVGTQLGFPAPTTVAGMTEDLRARFLPHRKPGERWGILGVSLGGMVALDWMARHPEDFSHGVVVNTSAADAGFPWERLRYQRARDLARCAVGSDAARERTILGMTTRLSGAALEEATRTWTQLAVERPVPPDVAARQLAAGLRFTLPQRLYVPALVMVGRGDRLVHPAISDRIASRLRLPVASHPDGGHDLPLDDPHWVVDQLATFVGRHAHPTEAA
ncbi:MAG: alpha/beta fold hydrolase [Deltaproteobacteria bacterium]|nr:alpha/beta fold hydrolase [Deltaproteobacteria bacterium]